MNFIPTVEEVRRLLSPVEQRQALLCLCHQRTVPASGPIEWSIRTEPPPAAVRGDLYHALKIAMKEPAGGYQAGFLVNGAAVSEAFYRETESWLLTIFKRWRVWCRGNARQRRVAVRRMRRGVGL